MSRHVSGILYFKTIYYIKSLFRNTFFGIPPYEEKSVTKNDQPYNYSSSIVY